MKQDYRPILIVQSNFILRELRAIMSHTSPVAQASKGHRSPAFELFEHCG